MYQQLPMQIILVSYKKTQLNYILRILHYSLPFTHFHWPICSQWRTQHLKEQDDLAHFTWIINILIVYLFIVRPMIFTSMKHFSYLSRHIHQISNSGCPTLITLVTWFTYSRLPKVSSMQYHTNAPILLAREPIINILHFLPHQFNYLFLS